MLAFSISCHDDWKRENHFCRNWPKVEAHAQGSAVRGGEWGGFLLLLRGLSRWSCAKADWPRLRSPALLLVPSPVLQQMGLISAKEKL